MYQLKGNDFDWLLFDLQTELKRELKERVNVEKINQHVRITIAYNWIMTIPYDEMDDLLDSVGESKGVLKDKFNEYKVKYLTRRTM